MADLMAGPGWRASEVVGLMAMLARKFDRFKYVKQSMAQTLADVSPMAARSQESQVEVFKRNSEKEE